LQSFRYCATSTIGGEKSATAMPATEDQLKTN
jgi:hypothetical protein